MQIVIAQQKDILGTEKLQICCIFLGEFLYNQRLLDGLTIYYYVIYTMCCECGDVGRSIQ